MVAACLGLASPACAADEGDGARIYREGVLPSGDALRGERDAGASVEGLAAACVTCHRRSGLGGSEGRTVVPPIIGKYLFRAHSTNAQDLTVPHVQGYRSTRPPYTAATLAQAIRDGVDPSGRELSYLMPRYKLDDASMNALRSYLEGLTSAPVPGVDDQTLHFATIITPDADPQQRKAMLEVMTRFVADKNDFIRGGGRRMQASREIEYRVTRRWQLHVWDLTGAPETWEQQLRAKLLREPVFAVISGLAGRNWSPVHHFCEQAMLPCLFPNTDLPLVAEADFYSIYFTRGVYLEADLMAERLAQAQASLGRPMRVRQVFRDGDLGQDGGKALQAAAGQRGNLVFDNRMLAVAGDRSALAAAVSDLAPGDALVLWLRPRDLSALPQLAPRAGTLLISGLLGGLEQSPLPAAWRETARLTYPVDLPEARRVRMNFPLSWFRIHNIEVVSERVQTDTYVALGILSETLTDMLDSFVRDYLVERVETMVSHRLVNGYFPRLGLAQGQRFASKGGYLVRFAGPQGSEIIADGEWTTP